MQKTFVIKKLVKRGFLYATVPLDHRAIPLKKRIKGSFFQQNQAETNKNAYVAMGRGF